jgi:hypothetical protein
MGHRMDRSSSCRVLRCWRLCVALRCVAVRWCCAAAAAALLLLSLEPGRPSHTACLACPIHPVCTARLPACLHLLLAGWRALAGGGPALSRVSTRGTHTPLPRKTPRGWRAAVA